MRRREFTIALGGAMIAAPHGVDAQPAVKVYRVGFILPSAPVSAMAGPDSILPPVRAFVHGLRDLGYVEGQNLVLERRSAEGRYERFGEIVVELVRLKVNVIVTGGGNDVAQVAKRVTSAVPIVMANSFDPVEARLVASLARPGGNITGFTIHAGAEIEAKRLQLLKEAVPEATRIAYLGTKGDWEGPQGKHVQEAARVLGVTLVHAERTATDVTDALTVITRDRPHALFVARHAANFINRQLIADYAVAYRLPGMFPNREFVEAGGLMSYGSNGADLFRRAAGYVDKILKGARPADLPVEHPTRFELAINLKAAKALGLTIPPALFARADEVIE